MWIVYDWSDGLVGIFNDYEKAEKEYQEYKKHNKEQVDGEFNGDEEVIIAKIDKRFYVYDTKRPVPTSPENTYWEWKEDKF